MIRKFSKLLFFFLLLSCDPDLPSNNIDWDSGPFQIGCQVLEVGDDCYFRGALGSSPTRVAQLIQTSLNSCIYPDLILVRVSADLHHPYSDVIYSCAYPASENDRSYYIAGYYNLQGYGYTLMDGTLINCSSEGTVVQIERLFRDEDRFYYHSINNTWEALDCQSVEANPRCDRASLNCSLLEGPPDLFGF